MNRLPVILDFVNGRTWKPGDEGYDEKLAAHRKWMEENAHRYTATNAYPPPDWRPGDA